MKSLLGRWSPRTVSMQFNCTRCPLKKIPHWLRPLLVLQNSFGAIARWENVSQSLSEIQPNPSLAHLPSWRSNLLKTSNCRRKKKLSAPLPYARALLNDGIYPARKKQWTDRTDSGCDPSNPNSQRSPLDHPRYEHEYTRVTIPWKLPSRWTIEAKKWTIYPTCQQMAQVRYITFRDPYIREYLHQTRISTQTHTHTHTHTHKGREAPVNAYDQE